MTGTIIQIVFLILLLFFFEFFIVQLYNLVFRGYAPLLFTRPMVTRAILKQLRFEGSPNVYELGAGTAGFLQAMRDRYPDARLTGVEYSFFPWFIASLQSAISSTRIRMLKKNLLKVDLSPADVVYCYLNNQTMKKLESKFGHELKAGAKVISYQHPLPTKEATSLIDLGKDGRVWVYQY